jgi:hypothetical protein
VTSQKIQAPTHSKKLLLGYLSKLGDILLQTHKRAYGFFLANAPEID